MCLKPPTVSFLARHIIFQSTKQLSIKVKPETKILNRSRDPHCNSWQVLVVLTSYAAPFLAYPLLLSCYTLLFVCAFDCNRCILDQTYVTIHTVVDIVIWTLEFFGPYLKASLFTRHMKGVQWPKYAKITIISHH